MSQTETKVCLSCGRTFSNRKKWKNIWEQVKYCSKTCSSLKSPEALMENILELLEKRGPGKTICPSELLKGEDRKNPQKMERVRSAARLLVHQGKIQITQRSKVVDPDKFKGPIRLGLTK